MYIEPFITKGIVTNHNDEFSIDYKFKLIKYFVSTILAKSYPNLKTASFLGLFFFSELKNFREYPNFGSEISC